MAPFICHSCYFKVMPLPYRSLALLTPKNVQGYAASTCGAPIMPKVAPRGRLGTYKGSDQYGGFTQVQYITTCTDGPRSSIVRFYGKVAIATPVWVWCSCPYFLFFLEVALTRRKSSAVVNSNGRLPIVRNPRLIPYLCKHLFNIYRIIPGQSQRILSVAIKTEAPFRKVPAKLRKIGGLLV